MIQEEKIIRKVSEIGNGAHIFAPKDWLDDEVMIIRIPRKNPKEEAIKLLYPHLDKIIAVFLFGSYARGEQEKESDLDIFVISSEKFAIKSKNMEVMVVPEQSLETAKKLNPILFYSMISEAKPIMNSLYLEKLKQQKIRFDYFKEFIKETKSSINSSEEIMKMDYKLKNKNASESVIYSLILRLRGIFIVNLLINGENYSKKLFAGWITKGLDINYEKVYKIYCAVRDNKKVEEKVPIEQAKSILSLLVKETKKLEARIK